MRTVLSVILTTATLLALSACGNKGGDSGGGGTAGATTNTGTYAATPQPCNNQGQPGATQNCQYYQNQYYNNAQNWQWYYGQWYWPQQIVQGSATCGCPAGYYPVQGTTFGVACAPRTYFGAYATVYMSWGNWGGYWNYPQNGGWINTPQETYSGSGNACGQNTAQGCDVRLNNCPSGSSCQPVAGGSTLGLCTR